MATLSIIKNINIKKKTLSCTFISALENAENKKSNNVILQRPYSEVKGEEIKKMFGENDDRV